MDMLVRVRAYVQAMFVGAWMYLVAKAFSYTIRISLPLLLFLT